MRRNTGPSAPSHRHDHEWELYGDESSLLYEEGVKIRQDCNYAEVKSSATCDRLDETFYEYGYECEATKTTRFALTSIVRRIPAGPVTLADDADEVADLYDDSPMLVEEIEMRAAERLCNTTETAPPEALGWVSRRRGLDSGPHTICVAVDGGTYRLTFERADEWVRQ